MGKPAARLGDMHVRPKVEPGLVPHVGGPIAGGSPNVFKCGRR
ncbi:PAAR motif protein [Marinomonas spartinae]|uniref:PAAR motif protein n=1 Tax=Marinomonas spartinae TaxID=1792290 RepID=A0A1A8TJR1_9GAMM|nr:PAAR domain-containing protein [Marinomonas spartinae]SBS34045.1 PAAR motif protein [Marinomonas spartinae]SBS37844.1 PAAR motif protein [Marinomonas spartinae]